MSYATRMPNLSPARVHLLVALGVVAVVSFSLGLAAAPLSRRLAVQTTLRPPVVHAPAAAPAITGARYDAGWAGGPGQGYQAAAVGAQRIAPWTACRACYEQGWAGGPGAGAELGSAATPREGSHPVALLASARHPRPEELVRLPWQIQDQVARTVLTPAAVFSDGEILTLPQQIQDQVRQAQQAPPP